MKKNAIYTMLASLVLLFLLDGCRKAREEYQQTLEEDAYAAATFDDAKNITDEAIDNGSLSNYKDGVPQTPVVLSTCATVTIDTLSSTRQITVDFGSSNCTCADGRVRRGKIISTFTGRYRDQGTVITHTFDNYFVDDNQVLGTKVVTNIGNYTYSVDVNGSIVLANNGGTITWTSARTRTWKQGYNTFLLGDDVYEVTGTAQGTNASGKNFEITITEPLVRKLQLGCARNFVQGTLEIEVDGGRTRTLDYGDGTCDNIGELTIRNRTYTITLR